jgi:hypothetical protein
MDISPMSIRTQRLCTWCAPAFLVFWIPSYWGMAHFAPPPAPNLLPEELARLFLENTNGIKLGLLLSMFGSALLAPFAAVISVQMKRIEGRFAPLANTQLALGALLVLLFIFPMMFLEAAAFRPDRSPLEIQVLSDIAWMGFIGAWFTVFCQWVSTGLCILWDKSPEPIFPRWAGYVNIWVATLSVFVIWLVSMTIVLFQAIAKQAAELDSATVAAGNAPTAVT